MRKAGTLFVIALIAVAGLAAPAAAQAPRPKATVGMPGIPPVFISALYYVAADRKLFEKYGVDVTLRQFATGTDAARAVAAGEIEMSMSPTGLVINQISNASVDMVAIHGYEKPTWRLVSYDPAVAKCEDMKGKPVAVDAIGGARSIALNQMLRSCNLTANDTQQVAVSANSPAMMIAGQLKLAVLHLDEVPTVEREAGKKLTVVLDVNQIIPVNHYLLLATTRKRVAEQRDTLVRVIAALIEAQKYMSDPKNLDQVAKAVAPTGRSLEDAKYAVTEYLKIEFWPKDSAGLDQKKLEAVIAVQKRVGAIRPDATPVTYDRLVDTTLWQDAVKLVK
jgi:NitT/TauT family transport system substrate-binding protein